MHPFDNTGGAESPFSALGYEGRAGAAAPLAGSGFAFGAALSYAGMDLGGMETTHDLTLDLGLLYRTGWAPLRLGAVVRNVSLLTIAGTAPALDYRLGATLEVPEALLALEAVRIQDQSTGFQLGGEYHLGPMAFRAGLNLDDASDPALRASFGVGFHLGEACRLDYAAASLGDLGFVQWISAGFPFGLPEQVAAAPAAPRVTVKPAKQEVLAPETPVGVVPSKPVPALAAPYRKSYDIFQKALAAAPSKVQSAHTPASFSTVRGFPLVAGVKDGSVDLQWDDQSSPKSPQSLYNVYVSIVPGADFRKLNQDPLTEPRWSGEMGLRGMTYYFRVEVVDTDGTETKGSEIKDVDLP
jgi:hypothetical protein